MKTLTLTAVLTCFVALLFAQSSILKTNFDWKKMQGMKYDPKSIHAFTGDESLHLLSKKSNLSVPFSGETPGSIVIGTTLYDLQTNGAIARRLLRLSDGTMTAVWTMSQQSSFADRGTGYAYFNGASWSCTNPTSRLEPIKTGWPNIGMLNGSEFIVCHNGSGTGNLEQGTTSGTGQCAPANWSFAVSGASAAIPPHDTESIWSRMAIQGNTIHVISNALNAQGESLGGVTSPFVYARSTDGGKTWTPNITLPLNTSVRRLTGGADEYDIDYNANTASIVQGGLGYDVALWESTNSGASWKHIYVDSFPYAPNYALQAPENVIIPTNDGAVSVVVDNSSKTHVAFSLGQVEQIDNNGYYFPQTMGLKYWEDGMKQPVWVVNPDSLPKVFDANGDGIYSVGVFTKSVQSLGDGGDQYGSQSWLSQPSISYDSNGNIFITFILPHDADTTFDGQTYRHIYLASHKAGDPWNLANWKIQDVNQNIVFVENVFATTARLVDDSIRIMYMEDLEPGTALNNGDPVEVNNINYIAVANPYDCPALNTTFKKMKLADLQYQFRSTDKNIDKYIWTFGDGTSSTEKAPIHTYASGGKYKVCLQEKSGCSQGTTCKPVNTNNARLEDEDAIDLSVSVYPNPFSNETEIKFSLDAASNAELKLYDLQGRLVQTIASGNYDAGEYTFRLNREQLSEGSYILQLKTAEGIINKKVIVQ